MNMIALALKIAKKAHKGQFRNDKITPYITHPIAVAEKLKDCHIDFYHAGVNPWETLQVIALLHDVIEDSDITLDYLEEKDFSNYIIFCINLLTKKEGYSYIEYLLEIKKDKFATIVKIEDIKHNLSTLDPKNKTMKDKYELALYILEN